MKFSAAPGWASSILVLVLVIVVSLGVLGAWFGYSTVATWDTSVPLFGDRLTMTGIGELQWHIFALLIMLSAAYATTADRHVRVDVFSSSFSPRTRIIIDMVGDIVLLVPFFALLFWFSWSFAANAYQFGEQSNSGGLIDRYLVKAVLPIGSLLMLGAGIGRIVRNAGLLLSGPDAIATVATSTHQELT
ncbi:TRAP transporter small permease subunit [uncultured Paracoccus sp.]|uniref:TRAP transporter small permease subunit n=1 Tax=uncultured Paracoccus sp. TaxID=189685 RepID=UPI002603D8B4|nr:TRAP transporter small permease subunit [uncultured Paracoccus sp.]